MPLQGEAGFWTLDFWGNITNLIGVVILGMAVPVGKWLISRREKILSDARKKEDERIASICKQFTDPMMAKLDNISTKVDYMDKVFQNKLSFDRDDTGDPDESGVSRGPGGGQSGGPNQRSNRPRSRRYDSYSNRGNGYRDMSRNSMNEEQQQDDMR